MLSRFASVCLCVCIVELAEASSDVDADAFQDTGTFWLDRPAVAGVSLFAISFCHDIERYGEDIKISSQVTKEPKYQE